MSGGAADDRAAAWGRDCGTWDTSVDWANLPAVESGREADFAMTTWHADQPLAEAFRYASHCAMHPVLDLKDTYIIHIAQEARASELLKAYRDAQETEA
jgi:hypothetical protein